jgi:hypothetical protein
MPALTSPQLTSLRANGHKAKFFLSVSRPTTLLTALINGSPARGATSIPYDTGGGTGFSRIKAGQTLLVVTATGTKNVRIRSISGTQTSGTITVATNEIVWADNQALTVLEDYEPRSWLPYFNVSGQFFKDGNIAYPGINPSVPPVCIAGPHRAARLARTNPLFFCPYNNSDTDLQGLAATVTGPVVYGDGFDYVPATKNLHTNPSVEVDAAGWGAQGTGTTVSRITTDAYSGSACIEVVVADVSGAGVNINGSPNRMPVTEGQIYTEPIYARVVGESSYQAHIVINWYTGADSFISGNTGPTITLTSTWQRFSFSAIAPVGAARATAFITRVNTGIHTYHVDAAFFGKSDLSYFDGDTPGCVWDSTPHASSSTRLATGGQSRQVTGALTNEVFNPVFANNVTDGWNFYQWGTGGDRLWSDARAYVGSRSCRLRSGTTNSQIYCDFTNVLNGQSVTVQAWLYIPTGSNARLSLGLNTSPWTNYLTIQTTTRDQWFMCGGTWTNNTGGTVNVRFSVDCIGTTNTPIWVGAAQFARIGYTTSLCYGSLPGHNWTGTPNNSPSARIAATLRYTNPLSTVAGTISLRWKPACDQTGPVMYLFSEGNLAAFFDSLGDTIRFTDGTNTISVGPLTFSAEVWQHLAFSWSSAGLKIYRNGALVASGATYTPPTLGTNLYIGSDSAGTNPANGLIDEFAVWGKERTAQDILDSYNSGSEMTLASEAFAIDLSQSYPVANGATITGYSASIIPTAGVTLAFNTSTGLGTATITKPDQYWLEHSCTDSNSQSQTTRRRLILHDPDPASADYPYTDFKVTALSGDWERGGWVLNIEVNGTADTTQFPENGLVMLWFETWYGDTKEYIGGITGATQMLFVGYIRKGTVTANWDRGSVSFEAATVEAALREHYMRNVPLQATASPGEWYEYANWLTPGRAAHHLWRWHSDLHEIADVFGLTANSLRRKYCDFPKGNLYSQADTLLRQQSIAAHVVSNKAGQIYVVQDIQLLDDTARAARTVVAEITKADRYDDITIVEQDETVAFVRVEGLYFDGLAITPYCAKAPGDAPEERGPNDLAITQQVLADQNHANNLAGRHQAVANNKYPEARVKFAGIYAGVLDIAGPFDGSNDGQEWWQMDLAAGDTTRGIVWTNKKLVCRTVNNQIDPANGMIRSEAVFEPEADGSPGVADDYCQSTPPTPTQAAAPHWDGPAIGALASFSSLYYRDDNDADWSQHSTNAFNHGCVDPHWKSRQGTSNPQAAILWGVGAGVIRRSLDAGLTWSNQTPVTDPPNTRLDSPAPTVANLTFTQILPDPWAMGRFIVLATWQNGAGSWRGWLAVTPDDGATWSWYAPYTGALYTQLKPIWAAINGASLLVATWQDRTTTKLMLHRRGAASLSFVAEYDLGNTTLAELNAKTYFAFPVCVLDDDALWHVAGRMNAPVGLAGTQHIIKTANTGGAWTSFESGWGTSYCAALEIGLLSGSNRDYKAVKS